MPTPNDYDSGISLKDDIASIRTDSAFHDVTLICADGVEIGACRAILASRSAFFKAMLYGNMQESTSSRVALHNVNSAAMHAVLCFIHTENVDLLATSAMIEVYSAASFFLLPKLMEMVINLVQDIDELEVGVSLLNEAVITVPWNDNTEELYQVLLQRFCNYPLRIGDLNGLSDEALKLLLTHTTTITDFQTDEYDLLLCVIEWAWARDTSVQSAERRAIFDIINKLLANPSAKIQLGDGPSRNSFLSMISHIDFTLLCPHRLKCLMEATDAFDELPHYALGFIHHACKSTICSPEHLSEFRGILDLSHLRWDESKLASCLKLSKDGTIVAFPANPSSDENVQIVRIPIPFGRRGLSEWDIVVESVGIFGGGKNMRGCDVGFIEETLTNYNSRLYQTGYSLHSWERYSETAYCKDRNLGFNFAKTIRPGDVISFSVNSDNRTCSVAVNGEDYGVIWRDLPFNVKLYPAVALWPQARYRIKPHVA